MRILVVEDEPKLADLLERGLIEEGHAADVARDGEDALWMARSVDYDTIVLDVMLPGLNGFQPRRRGPNLGRSGPRSRDRQGGSAGPRRPRRG